MRVSLMPFPSRKGFVPAAALTLAACLMSSLSLNTSTSAALAQSSPGGFSLPEPTPTPAPAPQGPVDVRSGVPIAPRSIPTEPAASEPAAPPEAVEEREPETTPAPTPSESVQTEANAPSAENTAPVSSARTAQDTPAGSASASMPSLSPEGAQTGSTDAGSAAAVPSLDPAPETAAPPPAAIAADGPRIDEPRTDEITEPQSSQFWLWVAAALGLAGLGIGAFALLRRRGAQRKAAPAVVSQQARSAKPAGAGTKTMAQAERPASQTPTSPAPPIPAPPIPAPPIINRDAPRLDLELEIAGATRSMMMFTLDCRITIANRSDGAVRDLELSGSTVCAQASRGLERPDKSAANLETIERIGPHQSRTIAMQLQLPLREIQPIRQGQKPLFVPLTHIAVTATDIPEIQRSFVIGSPSTASEGKLHPIPLDTPPGSFQGLRARQVKSDKTKAEAA